MDIAFANRKLKKVCERPREAVRMLGSDSAKKLKLRLADLQAAAQLGDIPAGHPHPLSGSRMGEFSVRLAHGHRLVFEANDDPIPTTANGTTDWKRITSIRIVFIGDYHE